MIASDQPTCFNSSLQVAISSRENGTMLDRAMGIHTGATISNRTVFCKNLGFQYGDVVYQRISYAEDATYKIVAKVNNESTTKYVSEVVADALYTETRGVGLFLPVADCTATVIHDPVRGAVSLLHLGRHSTLADLVARVIKLFVDSGSNTDDLVVWMSPSVQRSSYRLDYFTSTADPKWQQFYDERNGGYYIDMQGFNTAAFQSCGIPLSNIFVSAIDTFTDSQYFSHSAGDTHGRQAVIARLV